MFSVYLVEEDVRPEDTPTPSPLPERGETILLIEDDSELRTLAREMLEARGYRILAAGLPSEALEIAGAHPGPIHLLLTDVVMPESSGRQIADCLSATRPEMRALYLYVWLHGRYDPASRDFGGGDRVSSQAFPFVDAQFVDTSAVCPRRYSYGGLKSNR